MSSNYEDIKYSLTIEEYNGRVNTYTCDTEEELNSEFKQWWYTDRGVTPTGRVCFRGYGIDTYDDCVIPCDANGNYK